MFFLLLGLWQEFFVDFCGFFLSGDYLLVVIDDFSWYLEVEILRLILVKVVIFYFDSIFVRQGIFEIVRIDNGLLFNSESFQMFVIQFGFMYCRIIFEWFRVNGEVERLMKILEKVIRIVVI